jgi:hypothetical protein
MTEHWERREFYEEKELWEKREKEGYVDPILKWAAELDAENAKEEAEYNSADDKGIPFVEEPPLAEVGIKHPEGDLP